MTLDTIRFIGQLFNPYRGEIIDHSVSVETEILVTYTLLVRPKYLADGVFYYKTNFT